MGLVLDSSVIIAAERRGETVTQMLPTLAMELPIAYCRME
jgi:hypothetical protein